MGTLIPGAALIYERDGSTVYARYRDPPHNTIPRWVIGKSYKNELSWGDFKRMKEIAETNEAFKKQFDILLAMYYIIKDDTETRT